MSDPGQVLRYRAFGLGIASQVPLGELLPDAEPGPPDLSIERRSIGRPLPTRDEGIVFDFDDPDGVVMAWPGVAGVRLVEDRLVLIEPYADAPENLLSFPILGPVMAWMLSRKGLLVLHASAIEVGGRSVVLMGDKGAGKSTTAAAFVRAGHRLITDDLLAIDLRVPSAPRIWPAFPQLKLSDRAAALVRIDHAEALPVVMEGFPKRQHRLGTMRREPIGVDLVLTLSRGGDAPAIDLLTGMDAVAALMRFSYMPRFTNYRPDKAERAKFFQDTIAIANAARVGRLNVPGDIEALDRAVVLVERQLAGTPNG